MAEEFEPQSTRPRSGFLGVLFYPLVVLLLLIVGGGVFAYLYLTRPSPSGEPQKDVGRLVRVFKAKKTAHRVAVTVYGTSRASEQWTAIAEVHGRAVEVNPRFEPGEILPADLLVVRIDPTDYQLAVTSAEAEVRAKQKQLEELKQNEADLKEIFNLQDHQRKLAYAEYERQRKVFQQNAASRSALEVAENAYVTQLTAVQKTRNSLELVPVQRDLLQASLDIAMAQLAQAKRNLSKCDIRTPFAARCSEKSVEVDQYVAAGERLGTFLALEMAEVVAMVETRKMPELFPGGIKELGTLDLTKMSHDESLFKRVQVPAEVRWGLGDLPSVWYGRVARITGSLDPGTRTVPVIIEVPDPYENVRPGIRPPLVPGVFCEVTIYGATLEDIVVIPRDALRDGRVYLLRGGKLHIQPVTVLVLEENLAVISKGINPGDVVILTDLFPASEGMPLRGQVVENPVKPRTRIDFPEGIFEETTQPAAEATP